MVDRLRTLVFLAVTVPVFSTMAAGDDVERQIDAIGRAGPNGRGSAAARRAADSLSSRGLDVLPKLLAAMDTENIIAANWFRTVYERIVAHELAHKNPSFPIDLLRNFVRNPRHQGRSRRLVLRLLDKLQPGFRDQLIPTLLDDPEFHTDAVDVAIQAGDQAQAAGMPAEAQLRYLQAFEHGRESTQIVRAADKLKAMGREVNIVEQMGFVTRWYLIGPFDAPGTTGFNLIYPPETKVDVTANYTGKNGAKIRWSLHETDDRLGLVNLINAVGSTKEAVGYAYAELIAPRDLAAQLRCGADDNCTVWLNGGKIFGREQWLNGTRLDRFTAPAHLKMGINQVLVKVCQGPQHKNPAVPNNWSLQLRFCDETGAAVGLKSALPPAAGNSNAQ